MIKRLKAAIPGFLFGANALESTRVKCRKIEFLAFKIEFFAFKIEFLAFQIEFLAFQTKFLHLRVEFLPVLRSEMILFPIIL